MTAFALGVDIDHMLVATGVGPVTLMRGPEDCRGETGFVRHGIHVQRSASSLHRDTWIVSGDNNSPDMDTRAVVRTTILPTWTLVLWSEQQSSRHGHPSFSQVRVPFTGVPFSRL